MADRLLVVGFATAHVSLLAVFGILLLHFTSSLGPILEPIGTLTGTLLFGVLWMVALGTHHYGFSSVDPFEIEGRRATIRMIGIGYIYGAVTGGVAFVGFVLVGVARLLLVDPTAVVGLGSLPALLFVLLGVAFSLVIGGVVGVVASTFDAVVVRIIDHLAGG